MKKGSVNSIESFGLVDGPGIRTVVFLNGCKLRCKYCHNPEMWTKIKDNMTSLEVVNKVLRNKPYFKNNGGVTFSGGEPLLQIDFLVEVCRMLKQHNIHIALDTAGVGIGKYEKLLEYIDLVILDIKHVDNNEYKKLVGTDIYESLDFIKALNKFNIPVWIRQVIVPNLMDNNEYLYKLNEFLKNINNIERIDFLPYHKLGSEKYESLGIKNEFKDLEEMDEFKCKELYNNFINNIYTKKECWKL